MFAPADPATFGADFTDLVDAFTAKAGVSAGLLSNEDKLSISMAKTKPLQDAVELLSGINGIKISLDVCDKVDHVYAQLNIRNNSYSVYVDADKKVGYAIYNEENGKYNPDGTRGIWEGKDQILEMALHSIAMIARLHYPDKAPAIDKAIDDFIINGFPELPKKTGTAQPANAKPAPAPEEDMAAVVRRMQQTLATSRGP